MRSQYVILLGISCLLVVLIIGIGFFLVVKEKTDTIKFPIDVREKVDIIVSDRVPLGCFIPPDVDETKFKKIKEGIKKADIKFSDGRSLFEHCFILGGETGLFKSAEEVDWKDIKDILSNGIKVDGYCYDCNRVGCLCLDKPLFGLGEDYRERRSIDFGVEEFSTIGKNLKKQSFVEIRGQPSVFVVKPGEEPKLSIYAGIFLKGQKRVEKVTAALYKGTVTESNRISNIAGKERSCYIGENWNCYHSCRNSAPKSDCRMKCDCYTNQRYYDEDSLEICKNFCNTDFEGGTKPEDISYCVLGCEEGEKRYHYRECMLDKNNVEDCQIISKCSYCGNILDKFRISKNLLCEEDPHINNEKIKSGCERFIEIENSIFSIPPGNYTLIKVGNINLKDKEYRGIAFGVANITSKERHPGTSCYGPNFYSCYSTCWEEVCRTEAEGTKALSMFCKGEGGNIENDEISKKIHECENKCNCSITSRTDKESPFVLCKTFCKTREGFYGNDEKILDCQKGCDCAARLYEKPEFISFEKNVDLVFVVDTSNSMCESGSNEWQSLCGVVGKIIRSVEKENYKVKVTIYALGENGESAGCKTTCSSTCRRPTCKYVILNCSDINQDLNLNLDCSKDDCYGESWGPGVEWVIKNHPWKKDSLSRILFVISDEGPYCGGTCSVPCDDPYNDQKDANSISRAVEEARNNNVVIFALWGIGIDEKLKNVFEDVAHPTGGEATKYDTSNPNKVIEIISKAIMKNKAFETGYDKFVSLTREENTVPLKSPYIWREMYTPIFSNLIYIVDWNNPNSDWTYPLKGIRGNWGKIYTPTLNKSVEFNEVLKKIKELY